MNIKRLVISIVVIFIAVTVTDIFLHGIWLSSMYGATNHLWRPEAEMSSGEYMGWLHAGHALAAVTFTTLWAVGFAPNAKLSCGVKFGLFMALFILTRIKFWRFFHQLLASLCAVECSHDRTAFERPTD